MDKRGQVTLFIILGIVLVVVLVLFTVLRGSVIETGFGTKTDEALVSSQVESIRSFIGDCIQEKGDEVISIIGKQGGDLEPGLSQYWNGDQLAYLCYTENFTSCANRRPFLIEHMEEQISSYVKDNVDECLNFGSWESKGYTIQAGSYDIKTTIGDYNTLIVLTYDTPLKIIRGEAVAQENRFSQGFNIPLGKLANVAKTIVEKEISQPLGQVFTSAIIALYKGEIEIQRQTYGDSEIYILNMRDSDYKFQFAVKGWVY